jgi:hypothetical protein
MRTTICAAALGAVAGFGCSTAAELADDGTGSELVASTSEGICSNPLPPPLADISRGIPIGFHRFRFGGSDENRKNQVRAKMDEYESLTGTFSFVEDPSSSYVISVDPTCGTCLPTCLRPGCPMGHELGHLLGMAHEQQRIDAGRFISLVINDDICHDASEGTRYLDTIWSGTNYGPYNEDSVEHYNPVLGNDSTYDFTRRNGTVSGLGGDNSMEVITPGDVSMFHELQARHKGWDRFRSRGAVVDDGPLQPQLVSGVNLQANQQLATARVRRVDVVFVFGTNGRVYASSRGTKTSAFREVWSQANHIAATTQGGELVRARATSTAITTQRSSNADLLAATVSAGDNVFIDGLSWNTALNWGLPSATSAVTGFAIGSVAAAQLAVIARTADGKLWIRRTTSTTSVTGSWTQVTTGTAAGRPAVAALGGQLRVFYSTVSGSVTTLKERTCFSTSCGGETAVREVQTGSTAAVASSETTLHVVVRSAGGGLEWSLPDTGAPWVPIGGRLLAQPAVTNSFLDRIGSFSLFAELTDGNLWQKVYNRYFVGRLTNLTTNDYDRDGRTDMVIVRDGTWWIRPSTGLPSTPFAYGEPGDVFLPAADYSGDGVSDVALYRRSNGTWFTKSIQRMQQDTALPIDVTAGGDHPAVVHGDSKDRPVPGDYDGDWITDEAYFRPSTNEWKISYSTGGEVVTSFGIASDRQVPADYDGDGKVDLAVYRPSDSTWYAHPSGGGTDIVRAHCQPTDRLVPGDYDGDGRADFGCFRPSTGRWLIKLSTGEADLDIPFGSATDRVVPGDYDGDGRMDPAYFTPGVGGVAGVWHVRASGGAPDPAVAWGYATDTLPWPGYTQPSNTAFNDVDRDLKTDAMIVRSNVWWVHQSSGGSDISAALALASDVPQLAANLVPNGVVELLSLRTSNATWFKRSLDRNGIAGTETSFQFGASTEFPVPGDYDGDGLLDEAMFRPSTGLWRASLSGGGADFEVFFGESTDKPVPADYDGDGRTDAAIFRPSLNKWFAHPSAGGADLEHVMGAATDRFVPADYDGDRRADFAVFKPSTGTWRIRSSATLSTTDTVFGSSTDRVVPGDYDGDGRTDLAYFRPSTGVWKVQPSGGGSEISISFGQSTDKLPWPSHIGN